MVVCVGCKISGLNPEMRSKLRDWSTGGASGIWSVAVKCVDIPKNTKGEGSLLDRN